MSSKITFYLKEPTSKSETLVYCLIYINRNLRFKLSAEKKLKPTDWNGAKQIVKKSNTYSDNLNEYFKKLKSEYENLVLMAQIQNLVVTKEYLVSNSKSKTKKETDTFFFMTYDEFIKSRKSNCSKPTIQKYTLIKKYLKDFSNTTKYNLTFATVDLIFYEKFTQYLLFNLGMFNNTVSKTLKFVKTFMNYSVERGITNNLAFKKFKDLKDNSSEIIALNTKELIDIASLENLPNYLEKCKDLFLFLCYTSARFSDLKSINGTQVKDNKITYLVKKTKEQQTIFLNDTINSVLKKYIKDNIVVFPELANVNANKYLKEIGQLAGLNEPIKKTRMKGGEAITKDLQKWQLLTTHTGRRTFTTLGLAMGINSEIMKKITGHKTDREFKKYQKFNEEQMRTSMEIWDK